MEIGRARASSQKQWARDVGLDAPELRNDDRPTQKNIGQLCGHVIRPHHAHRSFPARTLDLSLTPYRPIRGGAPIVTRKGAAEVALRAADRRGPPIASGKGRGKASGMPRPFSPSENGSRRWDVASLARSRPPGENGSRRWGGACVGAAATPPLGSRLQPSRWALRARSEGSVGKVNYSREYYRKLFPTKAPGLPPDTGWGENTSGF